MFWILHRNPGTRSATRRHLLPPCQTDRPRKIRCTRDRGSGPHEISPGRSLHRNPTPWVVLSVVGWDRSRHVGAKEQGLCFVPPFFAVFSPFPSQYSLEYRVVKRMIARQPPSLDTDGRSLMNCAFLFFFWSRHRGEAGRFLCRMPGSRVGVGVGGRTPPPGANLQKPTTHRVPISHVSTWALLGSPEGSVSQ